ncbi:MAG: bifunctional riboflavin kinase/FAD synthetase [Ignavibacteria bacterium]|nr:bifunctional riboflavin kinase/FAD synthetase [Ignavibacteria bacterium]
MKVYKDISEFSGTDNTVVTVGSFDGLHKGHMDIINRVVREAEKSSLKSCVVTFDPHPRTVVTSNFKHSVLTLFEEKQTLLEKAGVDNLVIINFTSGFSSKSYLEFIEEYLIKKLRTKKIVIGYDHKFGKNRLGDKEKLRQITNSSGVEVIEVNAVKSNSDEISSTKIRNAISDGDIEKANKFLGRYYTVTGIIVKGAQRGRKLGYPTANILADEKKLIPGAGVYVSRIFLGKNVYFGLTNIGLRPTFNDTDVFMIETNIFDFEKDIYGEKLTVEFIGRIRDEIRFGNADMLIEQIKKDKEECLKYIKNLTN